MNFGPFSDQTITRNLKAINGISGKLQWLRHLDGFGPLPESQAVGAPAQKDVSESQRSSLLNVTSGSAAVGNGPCIPKLGVTQDLMQGFSFPRTQWMDY